MNKINLAFCVDSNFAQHLTVTLFSIQTHLGEDSFINAYIVYNDFSQEKMDRLNNDISTLSQIKLFFIKDNGKYGALDTKGDMTESAFLKINLPNTLPQDLDKVLYMDCDIVVAGDITELYDQEVRYLKAVRDANAYLHKYYDSIFQLKNKNGYFNAGVMLMNLTGLRNIEASKRIMEYAIKYSHKFYWHDQTAFNYLLHDMYEQIHPKFNFLQCSFSVRDIPQDIYNKDEYKEAKINPVVIHYAGGTYKPWKYESIGPYRNLYYKYLNKTSYDGYMPKKTLKKLIEKFSNYFIMMVLPIFIIKLLIRVTGEWFLYKMSRNKYQYDN